MIVPNVEVWALPTDGPAVCLTDLGDYEISRVDGEAGTVQIDYPGGGAGWEYLARLADPYRRLRIEIRTDGTSDSARQAILTDAKGDATVPDKPWTFTGLGLGLRLTHATTPYSEEFENGDTIIQGTPGVIMRTLLAQARARGVLLDLDDTSFTNSLDSRGQAWLKEATLTYSPGRDYLNIVQELAVKLGMCEWDVVNEGGVDRLKLYNPDSRGVDRTLPGEQVTLEYGRDFGDGPVTASNRDVGTDVLGVGVNGMYTQVTNPAARALLGEKIEIYKDFGSVYDEVTLDELTQAAAEQAAAGARSYSHDLVLGPDSPTPGVDYDVGDWILRGVGGTTERVRVSQLVLRRQGAEVGVSVTLGDLLADQEVKTRRMVDSIVDGSSIVGTSTQRPDVDDGKTPAAPGTPTVTTRAGYDGQVPVASVSAAWVPVVLNDDGTALDNLRGYEVGWRFEPGQDLISDWQIAGTPAGEALTWGPVPVGKIVQVRVRAVNKWNRYSAWSPGVLVTTAADADPPPTPSAPVGRSYLGLLTWTFDGKGASGEQMPGDFREVELHLSADGPLFAPHRPLRADGTLDAAASTTYRDRLTGPGELPVAPGGDYDVTWYGRWVAVDRTNNASGPSVAGEATLMQAGDGDVAELSIGKLRAGILTALMTVAGIIRTAAAGARVELDTAGLRCIGADGTVLLEFSIPNSLLTLVGKLVAGRGVGKGATIVIEPGPPPRIRLYPDATTQSFMFTASSTLRPDGTTGAGVEMSALNAGGVQDGFSIWTWEDVVWQGMRAAGSAAWNPLLIMERDSGLLQLQGADIQLIAGTGGSFYADTGGGVASIDTGPSGEFNAGNDNNYFIAGASGSQVVSGGSVKSFVIDHPTDPERLLVHGCVEGPEAAVFYRGTVVLDGTDLAMVELPAYFAAATVAGTETVHLTPELTTWRGPEGPTRAMVVQAAPTAVQDGRFYIVAPSAPAGTRVHWTVMARRADVTPFEVEPPRADVQVRGDGPYRYLSNPDQAA